MTSLRISSNPVSGPLFRRRHEIKNLGFSVALHSDRWRYVWPPSYDKYIMGAYAECWLESSHIGSTKYDFDFRLMQLFRHSDKRVQRLAVKNLPDSFTSWIDTENPKRVVQLVYYSA